jgi:hypothetical protein
MNTFPKLLGDRHIHYCTPAEPWSPDCGYPVVHLSAVPVGNRSRARRCPVCGSTWECSAFDEEEDANYRMSRAVWRHAATRLFARLLAAYARGDHHGAARIERALVEDAHAEGIRLEGWRAGVRFSRLVHEPPLPH